MLSYIIRRVLQMIPTLFGVMLLLFVLFNGVGGDPSYILAGKSFSEETLANIRAQLGLDQPLYMQFLLFVQQVLTLDFGTSWATQQPVSQLLASRVWPSVTISGSILLIGTVFAVLISAVVAYYRGSVLDRGVTMVCTIAMSVSSLIYIIYGQFFLAHKLQLFPIFGWSDSFLVNITSFLLLPLLLGVVVGLAGDIRFMRSCLVDEMNHDYVRTARAKGLSETKIMLKHVMRNAMIPVVTALMSGLPFLITGAIVMERFFGIPGMGNEIVLAVERSDFPVMKAITIYIALGVMVFNLLGDIVYKLIDPRVQLK